MNDRDISIRRRNASSETSFFALPTLLYGIYAGALGGVVNAFLGIGFFGSFTLYLGQVFVLICLVLRGINAAIIAVAISSLVMAVNADDPYLIIILALEVFFAHLLLKRGFFLLQSIIIYWVAIGIPLLLTLSVLSTDASNQFLFINGLTLAINGLICVSIASITCWLLPSKFFNNDYYADPPKLASVIFSLCMLTVTLPALLISLFFIYQSSTQNEALIRQSLKSSATEISQIIDTTMNAHIQSLATLSGYLSDGGDLNEARQILANIASDDVSFSNTMILDAENNIVAVGPSKTQQRLSLSGHKALVNHPDFQRARNELKARVSGVLFSGIISGKKTILKLVPIIKDRQYAGIVVGIVAVPDLARMWQQSYLTPIDFIVVDAQQNVVSTSLKINTPSGQLTIEPKQHSLIKSIPILEIGEDAYLYQQVNNAYGWSVIALTSPAQSTAEMINNFIILLICAALLLVFFAFIAMQLSKKITRPLEDIIEHFPDKKLHPRMLRDAKVSRELVALAERLVSSHAVINDFQHQLSEQVDNKTRQLKQLNRELYSLAQKDSLTQLLNRAGFNRFAVTSYRNCVRNRITMSLILIDIDHFKIINDTYGHPFGDKCIIKVSEILKEHCKRDTDIIGRFGGEEFIIMIMGGEIAEHHERMQLIKDGISRAKQKYNHTDVKMTVSAGILSVEQDYAIDFEAMIKLADDQLYLSKRSGRNKISIHKR